MWDFLNDYDVVQATELGVGYIIMDGIVYDLGDRDLSELDKHGTINLLPVGEIEDFKQENKSFYNWYTGNID